MTYHPDLKLRLLLQAPNMLALNFDWMTWPIPIELPMSQISSHAAAFLNLMLYTDHSQGHDEQRRIHEIFLEQITPDSLIQATRSIMHIAWEDVKHSFDSLSQGGRLDVREEREETQQQRNEILCLACAIIHKLAYFDFGARALFKAGVVPLLRDVFDDLAGQGQNVPGLRYLPERKLAINRRVCTEENVIRGTCSMDGTDRGQGIMLAGSAFEMCLATVIDLRSHGSNVLSASSGGDGDDDADYEMLTKKFTKEEAKGAKIAHKYKLRANDLLRTCEYKISLPMYSLALHLAPATGGARCVYLANRSECLLRLQRWRDALWDAEATLIIIESVLQGTTPKEAGVDYETLQAKAQTRKQKAMEKLQI
eukprot:TRINITY_DN6691_c0_g1_i8.p1 TRINITY_DN6691_c0_g1~~TRINITY_DN6691_c0_g1_i8.p1  ORF type:complete len:431 (-),score=70.75 TRINITY_DN6691_c0_g1_i8:148-1248(-)